MNHFKTFESFLNERDFSTPVSIEVEAGKVKVYANPEEENWRGEIVQMEIYEGFLKKMKQYLKDEDDAAIKQVLSDIRDLPLFAQDTSNAWKMSQIDGVEQFRSQVEYRLWLLKYCIRKIELFNEWSKNQ